MRRIYLLLFFIILALMQLFGQEMPQSNDTINSYIDSIYRELPEVMISGERPLVKATQGKLVYDLPRLIKDLPVDNVYDAVKELPGVAEINGGITLAGQSVTVVIDGKVTNMTPDQLNALLKTIPASRIENAEVMYSAPARYQVRGAMINICLKQGDGSAPSLQGEVFSEYNQQYYANLTERTSLLYSGNKLSADFLYSYGHGRGYFLTDKEAMHTLEDGSKYQMNTNEVSKSRHNTHSFRLGVDYNFTKDHQLSIVYNGNITNGHNHGTVNGVQISNTRKQSTSQLHNGRMDYRTPFGMKAGVEFTYYNSPSTQLLHSRLYDQQLDFLAKDGQRINRWKAFLAKEHTLTKEWGINYGIMYMNSIDNSFQYYYQPESGKLLPGSNNMSSRHREQTLNLYAGFNKNFGESVSLDVSMAVEQYHNEVWNEWNIFPTLNLSYMPSAGNVWQLSLSSDKGYPEYWATQDAISYLGGGYSEIHGNPYLKPNVGYQTQLLYVLNNKYIFTAWFNHSNDYFVQTLYQSPERLLEIYKYLNFDYKQQTGVQAVIPFKIKEWLNSRITLIGVYDREKDCDFWDIPFDRKVVFGMAFMNNTFMLSSKPNIKLIVNGMVRSKATQGIYDLPASGNVDIALRYTFAKGKALLTVRCNDIFETSQVSPRINFETQNVINNYSCFRQFGISFSYKFGGYKERQRESVDTSRFK
ncbi:outer membrane beta-barrel protein [Oscillospiraceae bacterium N12]|jgi:hypothetical protein|uniref:Outer membrane beta-barrel protein n=2 Tax=Jilunia laotingensis TaxID=2763675 RepID=A0A926IQQ7_9BACT|nr:outer membrane beta-barrel protein [Jilunia laotingensis]